MKLFSVFALFVLTRCAPSPRPASPPPVPVHAAATATVAALVPPTPPIIPAPPPPAPATLREPVEVGLTYTYPDGHSVRGAQLIPAADLPPFSQALPNSQTCCVAITWRFMHDDAVSIEGATIRFALSIDGQDEPGQSWTVRPMTGPSGVQPTGLISHMRFPTYVPAQRVWPHHKLSARLEVTPSAGPAPEPVWTVFGPIFAGPVAPQTIVLQRGEAAVLNVLVDRNGSTRSRAARH
jgi:hypothetical protein